MTGTTQKQQKVKIEDGQDCNNMVVMVYILLIKCCNYIQDRAPKIAKLPYKWFNYGLW